MARIRTYSPATSEALRLLGAQVGVARRERRWTTQELADRVGITKVTLLKIEHGDPSVRLGDAFEAATIVGVPLFHPDPERRRLEASHLSDRLAALPQLVRRPVIDDEF